MSTNETPSNYSFAQGVQMLEKMVNRNGPIFTLDQILSTIEYKELSSSQIRNRISKLAKSGWIKILKRGAYMATRSLYSGSISPFGVAAALVQPMAISHWSAVAHHGFTTQNPVMTQATTTRKVKTPEMRNGQAYAPRGRATWRVNEMEFEFIYTQPEHFWGFDKIWVGEWYQINITDKERTVLDLLVSPDIFGGVGAAIEIFEEALPELDIKKIVDYAIRYDVGAVIKRLGWILERLNTDPLIYSPLLKYKVEGLILLDSSGTKNNKSNNQWNVIDNLKRG